MTKKTPSQGKTDKKAAAKKNTKVLQQQRKRRRQWITFVRMCRYGVNNFSRNAWLTAAATAVMTVTLVVVFLTVASQHILSTTVKEIGGKVDMSIYLKTDVTYDQAGPMIEQLRSQSNVQKVTFVSADEAQQKAVQDSKTDKSIVSALAEANNKFPAVLRVSLEDINDVSQLNQFVQTSADYKKYKDVDREPSFKGERREAIQTIGGWVVTAQRVGYTISGIFAVISSLIVFNTIRMAIFSRKEEIAMMKLIGADKSFIRGPFIVEATFYGFLAALLATGIGYGILMLMKDTLIAYGVAVQGTIELLTVYIGFVLLGVIAVGALIGVVSSWLATQRYLKI